MPMFMMGERKNYLKDNTLYSHIINLYLNKIL
jgi:hypothetical protein